MAQKPAVGSAPKPATPRQIRRIVDLMRAEGIEDDVMAELLNNDYNVHDPHKMTEAEAERVLNGLEPIG